MPTLYLTKEDNFVPDLEDESIESIQKSEILTNLANNLRQFRNSNQLNELEDFNEITSNINLVLGDDKEKNLVPIKILPISTQKISQYEVTTTNTLLEKPPTVYSSVTALNLLFTTENIPSHTG